MKLELLNKEVNAIWRRHATESNPDLLQLEPELDKKLLNFFQVGDYYYYIFNVQTLQFDLVSAGLEVLLGYNPAEFTIGFLMQIIHPDDISLLVSFEDKGSRFLSELPPDKVMKYKIRYDYRIKKKDDTYIRVLHQAAIVQTDENGGLLRTLGVHTDITHLKKHGEPVLSLIGMDGEPSYVDIGDKENFINVKEELTKREKEILLLLIEGKLSKQIAGILNISIETVNTHRKNMMYKNNVKNTGELVGKAIRKGWI